MRTHLILLWHGYDYSHLHFTSEETEAPKEKAICPRSQLAGG